MILHCKNAEMTLHFYSVKSYNFYVPNFEKVGDILVSTCPCVCIHVRDIVLKLHVWIPHGKILVFPELSPLVKLRPFDKQGDEIL